MQQMPDISHLINTVLPIIVFVLWLIASMFANARKKSRQHQVPPHHEQYPEHHDEIPSHAEDQPEEGGKKGPLGDDLKRSLEVIFDEMGLPHPGEEPAPRDQPEQEHTVSVETAPVKSDQADSVAQEYRKVMQELEERERDAKKNATILAAVSSQKEMSVYALPEEMQHRDVNTDSLEEVRSGVIWSEVLAPPLALRE